MNTKIIRMAQKAGLHLATETNWLPIIDADYAERLIQIAQAEEREACAKVCEELECDALYDRKEIHPIDCAIAIRSRGNDAVDS